MMKKLFTILILALILIIPASATINITVSDIGYNFIHWTWSPPVNITNVSVDGVLINDVDPQTGAYILSGIGPGELHQINVYSSTDTGVNLTRTEYTGDVPVGVWIYGFVGVLFLILARWSQVRFVNLITPVFGLLGIYQLIQLKSIMDGAIWSLCLIIYLILLIAGGGAYLYGSGRK